MTAQSHDLVVWNHSEYLLVGVEGRGLFDPVEHGLVTQPTTTANWRGWVARYGIRDDVLLLLDLHDVGLVVDPGGSPPVLLGVEARQESRARFEFPDIDRPLRFTGRLLIARGFIQSLYVHMGFHPAWKFEESWEIAFEDGRVIQARDLSEEMAETRERIGSGAIADPDEPKPGWISRTFRLDFRRSKPDRD